MSNPRARAKPLPITTPEPARVAGEMLAKPPPRGTGIPVHLAVLNSGLLTTGRALCGVAVRHQVIADHLGPDVCRACLVKLAQSQADPRFRKHEYPAPLGGALGVTAREGTRSDGDPARASLRGGQ